MRIPWLPRLVRIEGDSMLPTLRGGELRFVRTDPVARRRLRRGDIVVFRHPWDGGMRLIKRIAAVPGDPVTLEAPASSGEDGSMALSAGEYFVLSDNTQAGGDDSRRFGPISHDLIEGRLAGRRRPLPRGSS